MDKNQASETFCSKFGRCQSPKQLQNLKILLPLWGHKNPYQQNVWNLNFFYLKRQVCRYYQEKNQVGLTSSYINLTMKLFIKLCRLTKRHGVTRKRCTKRLKHTGNVYKQPTVKTVKRCHHSWDSLLLERGGRVAIGRVEFSKFSKKCYLFLGVLCMCVFHLFTRFLSILFVFQERT